ncbi:muconolactone Delta-isomerase [Crocosphaera sp. Alani8]|uniref:muconolactone Delta-isomerase n=1 Tax=Crocosphaera sp. Alani8 TaxID=3038952 RepID=UPI00313B0916
MLYLLDFLVEYGPTMTQTDLFSIWSKEAEAALNAKKAGIIVDLWKCVGERRVIAIVNVDSPDTVDQIIFTLPIMKAMGQYVNVKVTSLRRYEDFAGDVNQWLKESNS